MTIVAQIAGGLGNQLFIYAMGRAISIKSGIPLKLDVVSGYKEDKFNRRFLLDNFNVCAGIATVCESYGFPGGRLAFRLSSKINSSLSHDKRWILADPQEKFESEFAALLHRSVYLMGYWQSYKYFQEFAPQIKRELTLKAPLDEKNKRVERDILDSESVSIHVRQDNLNYKLSADYYLKAVEIIGSKVKNPKYYIFSDSSGLSQKLAKDLSARLVNINSPDECCKDLWLMSCCRHHITANSTFSWWGAWLADSKGKQVVVPASIRKFNTDIIPPEWLVLDY